MTLPDLTQDWTATQLALHQAAQLLGAIRAAVAVPQINYLHLGLKVLPGRLSTGQLPALGEWHLDLRTQTLHWYPLQQEPVSLPVRGHSQRALTDTALKLLARGGYHLDLDRSRLDGETPLAPNPTTAAAYGDALTAIFEVFERVRGAQPGAKTPLVVWPQGFDLSFLWFPRRVESEEHPHMSFGFSPASEGLARPYFYAYARPIPPDLTSLPLPDPAHWHTSGWTGMVLPYDEVAPREDAETVIAATLRHVFEQVSPLLGGS